MAQLGIDMRCGRIAALVSGALVFSTLAVRPCAAQQGAPNSILPGLKFGGSRNVQLLSHLPLGGYFRTSDVEIEQEPSRPYVYVAQMLDRAGFSILDVRDPAHARMLYRWTIPEPEAHRGLGALKPQYFKSDGRYYLALDVQFTPGSPDADVGAIIFDVTGLPDTTKIKEVARIRAPVPGGFHSIFAYKHSDGRVMLFAAPNGPEANVYDMQRLLAGAPNAGLIATIPIPDDPRFAGPDAGYRDVYAAFDPASHQDRFFGAGSGGYFVYDVTRPEAAKLLTSIVGSAGVDAGSSFTPTPDGRYAVAGTGVQYSPLRIFDLEAGLDGKVQAVTRPIGAWTADWHDVAHNHEVRWPFVFVSAYEDGLQIFNMADPRHPQTVAWYYTCQCPHEAGFGDLSQIHGTSVINGAVGVDVRNADGLIAVSDANTGFWLFRLEGFGGWKGEDYGMPNVSSAQPWDRGPLAATRTITLTP